MANEKRLIDAEPIKKFIVDGLNNPDLKKAFGHDAIEILTEIEYAPTVDAVEVVHARWEEIGVADYKCSRCGFRFTSADPISMFQYCRCGAKMEGGNKDVQATD